MCHIQAKCLFVDPVSGDGLPVNELLRLEPQSDLLVGALDGVAAVADVAACKQEDTHVFSAFEEKSPMGETL